jgi:hypothetical protein
MKRAEMDVSGGVNVKTAADALNVLLSQPSFPYPTAKADGSGPDRCGGITLPPTVSLGYSSHSNLFQIILGISYSELRRDLTSKKQHAQPWGAIVDKQYSFVFNGPSDHAYLLSILLNWWMKKLSSVAKGTLALPEAFVQQQPPSKIRGVDLATCTAPPLYYSQTRSLSL